MGTVERVDGFSHQPKNPAWLTQSAWYIDQTNGLDTNPGTSGAPIKTMAELSSRWGNGNTLNPPSVVDPQGSGVTANFCDVFIVNGLPTTDPISFDVIGGANVVLRFWGQNATTNYTGSITGGLVTRVQATNTPWSFQDTGTSSTWTVIGMGMRIRNTNVTRNGLITWTLKDLGTQTVRTSEWVLRPVLPNTLAAVSAPVAADTYVVETLQTAYIGRINYKSSAQNTGSRCILGFLDLQLFGYNNSFGNNLIQSEISCRVMFSGCRFVGASGASASFSMQMGQYFFENCCLAPTNAGVNNSASFSTGTGSVTFQAGAVFTIPASFVAGSSFLFSNDVMFQGTFINSAPGTDYKINSGCGIFDATGAGVVVNPTSEVQFTGGNLWGAGNSQYGVRVRPGGFLTVTTATNVSVTGSTADFLLGGSSVGWNFNTTTGVYQPAAGLTLSWANFVAAAGQTGFGGNAVNPLNQCGIVTNA